MTRAAPGKALILGACDADHRVAGANSAHLLDPPPIDRARAARAAFIVRLWR
jgi:hypothetical protein